MMTLSEKDVLKRIDNLSKTRLRICIQQAWVTPARGPQGALFDETDLARLHLIADLRRDMGVNDDAMPIILSLIDQLHATRRRLGTLSEALSDQPEDIRARVLERLSQIGL